MSLEEQNLASRFIGGWRLVSCTDQTSTGQALYPYGEHAQGRLIYDHANFAAQVWNPDRPRFASADLRQASESEVRTAFFGYGAYYGRWSIRPDQGTVIHHVEACYIPNLIGGDQVRYYRFDGDYLILRTPPMQFLGGEAVATLVWERLP